MKYLSIFILIAFYSLFIISCNPDGMPVGEFTDTTVSPHGGPLILVHYMPWYRGPSIKAQENNSSSYGGHWTDWGRFNPTQTTNGRAQIQAKQYPLTGPYHSSNTSLLEYQVSLFIIAGIDGVIFDWYGSYDSNDFLENHGYTVALVNVLRRAGLFHSIMYEDNTLNMMVGKGGNDPAPVTDESLRIGRYSFDWAQTNWFAHDPLYIRYEGRPIVFCFGPQHFVTKAQWDQVFINAVPAPFFIDLYNRYPFSDSTFNWPPVNSGTITSQSEVINRLNQFYNRNISLTYKVASVFSAFDDFYNWGSHGHIAYDNGAVFDLTWKRAIAFNPHIIQIVTWNDYGEGTIIEPTIERGYNELEYVQDRVREYNSDFPFTKLDLRWPLEFYKLRYTQTASSAQLAAITAATNALFAGDVVTFRTEAAKTGASVSLYDLKPLLRN